MLFHSALRKELSRSFGATFVVLLSIVMTMTLFRVLGLTTRGGVNPADLMIVLWYTVLGQVATLLSLSLCVAIVSTLSRMYKDSEMVIWFASGQGLLGFLRPIIRFAWPVLLVIGLLVLFAAPWAAQQTQHMKERYEKRGDLERITPGQFQESAGGNRVFFIDKTSPDAQTGRNIFIVTREAGKETLTSAQSGRVQNTDDGRFLILENGQRLELSSNDGSVRISDFDTYSAQIGAAVISTTVAMPAAARTTWDLIQNPTPPNLGQLAWRLGLIIASIIFTGLALAAGTSNPRVGRSANMIFAAFAFFLVFQLLNLGQTWIANGKATLPGVVLGINGITLVVVALWLTKLHNNWTWRSLLPRPRTTRRAGA